MRRRGVCSRILLFTAWCPISRITFYNESGEQLEAPREWERAWIAIECGLSEWEQISLLRSGVPLALQVSRLGGEIRVLADWPRAGAGHYEIVLEWQDGSWCERSVCTVVPRKLGLSEVEAMISDLQRRLPASIVIGLQRAGAFVGVHVVSPQDTTLAEEIHRLTRAIDGTQTRPGLARVLQIVRRRPHAVLRSHGRWSPRHRARSIDVTRLPRALTRSGNIGVDRLPLVVPERFAMTSVDVYENQILQTFYEQINVRLRTVIHALSRQRTDRLLTGSEDLLKRLLIARREADFLDGVRELPGKPSHMTMVLLKRSEYRAALEGLVELRRSSLVHLEDPRTDAPLENLPRLYERWGMLSVIAVVLELAGDLGYEVERERIVERRGGELWVRVLQPNAPAVVLCHPRTHTRVSLTPQRRYERGTKALSSVSFDQIPDLSVLIEGDGHVAIYVFDPKYKLRSESDETGGGDLRPKKIDVDAMHAYRDAVRDSGGQAVIRHAALLYPGEQYRYGGVSALSARPGDVESLRHELRLLLEPALTSLPAGNRRTLGRANPAPLPPGPQLP